MFAANRSGTRVVRDPAFIAPQTRVWNRLGPLRLVKLVPHPAYRTITVTQCICMAPHKIMLSTVLPVRTWA
jgi:hypothetical protein